MPEAIDFKCRAYKKASEFISLRSSCSIPYLIGSTASVLSFLAKSSNLHPIAPKASRYQRLCKMVTLKRKNGSPGKIRTSNISVNSLVPDLITIVPEPRQIEGNQQDLVKWDWPDLPSLCCSYSPFAAIHQNSYDTGMTLDFS
jgi:hypothetical protein